MLNWIGHQWECAKDVDKFIFSQAVQVGNQAIKLGAQSGTFGGVYVAVPIAA